METSKRLTGQQSYDLTSFAADIHANLSAQQENDKAKTTPDTSGRGSEKPLANYDPNTQSWKMYGDTSLWGEPQSLASLPPSGMTRNGVLYQQPAWVPITDVIESSSWPTPTAVTRPMEGNVRMYRAKIEAGEMTEAEAEAILGKSVWEAQGKVPAMWPTPKATDYKRNGSPSEMKRQSPCLGAMVQKWPTPTAADAYTHALKSSQQTPGSRHSLNLPSAAGGKLNPTWVEWLMGFPTGWTDLEA